MGTPWASSPVDVDLVKSIKTEFPLFCKGNVRSSRNYRILSSTLTVTNSIKSQDVQAQSNVNNLPRLDNLIGSSGGKFEFNSYPYHSLSIAYIPKGTESISIILDDWGVSDGIQLFTVSGRHLAGTVPNRFDREWYSQFRSDTNAPSGSPFGDLNNWAITAQNGFNDDALYDGTELNGSGKNVISYTPGIAGNIFITKDGMTIGFSGEGNNPMGSGDTKDYLTIDKATEDLIFCITGDGPCDFTASWAYMPADAPPGPGPGPDPGPNPPQPDKPTPSPQGDIISIKTQEKAQQALERIDDAIITKDKIRAHLGALQNRLENTVTNLTIQSENLQTAESRISDTDVASEMTTFVRNQVLTQSAVAMLGQANSYPHMLSGLITS